MKLLFIMIAALSCASVACNSASSPTSKTDSTATPTPTAKPDALERNKATALASEQAISTHNADMVLKDASPDVMDYGEGSMPPVKGIDSCKKYLKAYLTSFPDVKGENLMAIAEGNHVAVYGDWTGTFKNEMMGMKPTGKSFKFKDVDLFTFNEEGKIIEHRSVQSNETMMAQLGVKVKN